MPAFLHYLGCATFAAMKIDTVIFDMDGLLIDSEPCWEKAGATTLARYGVTLTKEQYYSTTGLRSKEWIDWWFTYFQLDRGLRDEAEIFLTNTAIDLIRSEAEPMPGTEHIFSFFSDLNFNIGLATSSPTALINVVAEKLEFKGKLHGAVSAENLINGKPHPEVYLDCATVLNVSPLQCICFEDSVYGMVAAKAARMKCVAIPAASQRTDKRFGLADLTLNSLQEFSPAHLELLMNR